MNDVGMLFTGVLTIIAVLNWLISIALYKAGNVSKATFVLLEAIWMLAVVIFIVLTSYHDEIQTLLCLQSIVR